MPEGVLGIKTEFILPSVIPKGNEWAAKSEPETTAMYACESLVCSLLFLPSQYKRFLTYYPPPRRRSVVTLFAWIDEVV